MLVSFNPAFSRSRVSNQNNNLNRAKNPNFKGGSSYFTPENLSKGAGYVEDYLRAINFDIVQKNQETINVMKKTLAIVSKNKNEVFIPKMLNPIVKAWEKTGKFPSTF